ncbi:Cyclin-dependent kinase 20 [Apophysomyces sp. BC1034]|nr:Cyclin-dependent kinase 20 [Apophysomyces sp. BC1021]KAG0190924.1 Cyclin-dependent kinase 20 [Apophysomyces sp. BC1034]
MGDRDQLVISDFGCAHLSSVEGHDDGIDEIGTRFYKAPEHLFGYRVYTAATDVWSLGVIFLELLSGTYLFPGGSDLEQIGMIKRALGSPSKSVINEEMNQYPDANKLIFFNGDGKDDTDTDEDEEYEEDEEERLHTLNYILDTSHILTDHQTFIRRILTWSIKNRISIEEILAFVEHENS